MWKRPQVARAVKRKPTAAEAAAERVRGERKAVDAFVWQFVRSLAHQTILATLAKRGAGVADPKELAEALGMKQSAVKKVLDDWRLRGFMKKIVTYPYYYSPTDKEKVAVDLFLKMWAKPEEHKRLMAMILEIEGA